MGKIGILTFHSAHNYGSVLQAYALQETIKENCMCGCEIINYYTDKQKEMYSIFKKNNTIGNILKNTVSLTNYKYLKNRHNKFKVFINNRFNLSNENKLSKEQLIIESEQYSSVICGSDQIWNINTYDFDEAYFLNFVSKSRKISYAPSFGGGNPLSNHIKKARIEEFLNDFSFVSVRENKGKEIINEIINKDVQVVLDPTLLRTCYEWDKICSKRIYDYEYIFFYSIDYNDDSIEIAKYLSDKYKLPVVILFTTNKTYRTIFKGFIKSDSCAPEDFISLIKYAKIILSSSFHGTVFSIIYRKPFYVLRDIIEGSLNNDDRLTTLLKKLGLDDRQVNINSVKEVSNPFYIEYTESEKKLDEERGNSLEYLKNAIRLEE